MDHKNLACTLYKNLDNIDNKIDIITKLFKIHKSKFYFTDLQVILCYFNF